MPLDARTDVFSTGIILHEMLTTEKLFRGDTEFALMEKVRKAEVPPPSNFNRRVTPEIDAIVLKALARDVADRYQSAQHLAQDLDNLIAGYRFDPKELRQFMRQMFRKEYGKELEETQQALESRTLDEIAAEGNSRAATVPPEATNPTGTSPTSPSQRSTEPDRGDKKPAPTTNPPRAKAPTAPPQEKVPEPLPASGGVAEAAVEEEKPRGFFASLFKRKK
jgi:serine/threonine protein kinase